MSYVPVFTDMMAQALAKAPTAEVALSVWKAMSDSLAPTVGQVLQHAVPLGNLAVFQACQQRLDGKPLEADEQGLALAGWRKSSNSQPSSVSETQVMTGLLDHGLIDARCRVRVRGKEEAVRGPGAHLLACLRFDGFETLLGRITLEQDDLDQCLYQLVDRASSFQQRDQWLGLIDRLLEAGANPCAEVADHKLNQTIRQSARQRVLSAASYWRGLPIEHQARLLGRETVAQWTKPSASGYCFMAAWIQGGGDLGVAFSWTQGQTIEPATLTRLFSVLLVRDQQEGGQGLVLDALDMLDARPAISCAHMVDLIHIVLKTAISLHGSGDGVEPADMEAWWARRAQRLLGMAKPDHYQASERLLETAGRWLVQALGPDGRDNDPRSANDMDSLRQQVEHIRESLVLEARTAEAAGRRAGVRL